HTGNSPGGRLRQVQTEYLEASARYSADHPDVVRLKREVDTLKKETGISDDRGALELDYKRAKAELAAAKQKYSDNHPDVAKLKQTVATLETKLKNAPRAASGFTIKPDNPAYVTLQTQLDTVELNLKALHEQRERAKQRIADYEARLNQTPRVEQEGLAMQREYESATKKYREIKQNLMGAQLAVELEKEQKGERYSILEAADLPDQPERPNRRAFILLGLVLGIGSGVGYASLAEYMDRTIRGARSVAAVLRAPPLAVIPYIPNGIDPPARTT
ncbi:MAG: lipopolysaccharide biosynthesis protein, partial [Sulfurifustis sp.]